MARDKSEGPDQYGKKGELSRIERTDAGQKGGKRTAGNQGPKQGDAQGSDLPKGGTGTEKGGKKGSNK